jgi:Cd2+/Zn2+-exporting ATPase
MLVIACPCALVLATPTAMVAALSAAARLGLLIKNVIDLETARNLTAVVFDKTGTLTTGTLSVSRLAPAPGVDGAELLWAAATAEQNSKHPVARALVEVARRARLELPTPEQFEEAAGRGVRAVLKGEELLAGRAAWLAERGADVAGLDSAGAEGLSLLYVTRGGRQLGWIGLEDKTRPEAARAMDELRALGLKQLIMVTGDRLSVARRVAAEMHCTDVRAEVLPAQKLELVDELKQRGHTVAVIGDGVNDAPALAAGHLAIAMGAAGSDVAIHSASVVLMNDRLNRIPFLIRLSRATTRVVRQNLLFGVSFILLLLGLSAAGWVTPVLAAALHTAGSIVVVFNSARLVREGEDLDAPAAGLAPAGAPVRASAATA